MFFHWSLETQIRKQNSLQNALRKSSPTITTFVDSFPTSMIIFLRVSGFPDVSSKVFLITFKYTFDFPTKFLQEQNK